MGRTVGIGIQDFSKIIEKNLFYVDKTGFIKEWWENEDDITLIARPRRFGKTLTLSMLEQFFSVNYAGRNDLFSGLSIWKEEKYQKLQGTYPVIFLSFARFKGSSFRTVRRGICGAIKELYNKRDFLLDSDCMNASEKISYQQISVDMEDDIAFNSLRFFIHSDVPEPGGRTKASWAGIRLGGLGQPYACPAKSLRSTLAQARPNG